MSIAFGNRYLTADEMKGNAAYIWQYMRGAGWSMEAVAAMLGNMESESTINPAIYESLDSSSSENGYGLVQWTPNTKFKEWADENGFTYEDIDGQLERIIYELENGLQWISTATYNMSFAEFSTSTHAVEILAMTFLYNYERPASLDQPHRGTQARAWYEYLQTITPARKGGMSKLLLYAGGLKRGRGYVV